MMTAAWILIGFSMGYSVRGIVESLLRRCGK